MTARPERRRRVPRRPSLRRPRRRRKAGLAALGDLLLDVVATSDRSVDEGTDIPGTVRFRLGGSAANTARAFARLGAGQAVFIGAVGRDALGRRLGTALRAEGVRAHLVTAPGSTGRLVAIVQRGGERSFITERGAANGLEARHIDPAWLRGVGVIHLPAYSLFHQPLASAAAHAAELARERGAIVSVDLASRGPLMATGRHSAWAHVADVRPDILLGNRNEAIALLGRPDLERLLELAPVVVVKEGSAGCRVLMRPSADEPASVQVVAATRIAAADTTGAGDAFAAGFLATLLAGGGKEARPWGAPLLRRAALAGHRAAADLLQGTRPELVL